MKKPINLLNVLFYIFLGSVSAIFFTFSVMCWHSSYSIQQINKEIQEQITPFKTLFIITIDYDGDIVENQVNPLIHKVNQKIDQINFKIESLKNSLSYSIVELNKKLDGARNFALIVAVGVLVGVILLTNAMKKNQALYVGIAFLSLFFTFLVSSSSFFYLNNVFSGFLQENVTEVELIVEPEPETIYQQLKKEWYIDPLNNHISKLNNSISKIKYRIKETGETIRIRQIYLINISIVGFIICLIWVRKANRNVAEEIYGK